MLRQSVLFSLALLLCACAQTGNYQRPAPAIPAQWPASVTTVPGQEASKTDWRHFFADPRLHALIESALQNNRDLRIAVGRVAEARAQYGIAKSDRFPTVNLLGSGTIGATPSDLTGNGTVINGQRYDLAIGNVSYEIDFWGRIGGLTEAARNSYLATEEARRAFQLSLVADVAGAYFTLLQLDDMLRLAQQITGSRETTLSVIGHGRDLGATYDMEFEQARGALESVKAESESLQHQRTIASNRLNYLVGVTLSDLPPGLDLEHQGLDTALAPGLPSEVLLARPDVMAAEQRLLASHANIGAARAAFLPKIALTAGLGVASQGLSSLFSGLAWNFQPAISLPLIDGGRLEASVDVAEARKVIAVADYEKTIQLAFREVADLLAARESLTRQMRSAEINEKSQGRRLEIAVARHHAGLINVLEVLDGERALVSAQQNSVQIRKAQLDVASQLYKALGGGA